MSDYNTEEIQSAYSLLVGERIGYGHYRTVHELRICDDKVIKFARADNDSSNRCNFIEYDLWDQYQYSENTKRWLAQCFEVNRGGNALIQEKLEIIQSKHDHRLPKRIPRFLTDTKVQNWGVDKEGNVKCCDYGTSLLLVNNPWQLTKAEWWEYHTEK